MWRIPMGRNEDLLTFAAVAELLNVGRRQLGHMVRQGYIRPAKVGRHQRDSRFRQEDVNALLHLRRRGVDLPKLAAVAYQSHALSLSTAAKLEKLCAFLGLENNRLRTDEDSVFMLHMKTHDTLRMQLSDMTTSDVMEWAAVFNGIDEGYLSIIEAFTVDSQPWKIYMELANQIMVNRSERTETNLAFAYSCLDASRRHLRHVSYFFATTRLGEQAANNLFIKGQVDDEIVAQLYPHFEGLPH